jgi:hypothetical protein
MVRLLDPLFGTKRYEWTVSDPTDSIRRTLSGIAKPGLSYTSSSAIRHRRNAVGRDYYISPRQYSKHHYDHWYISTEKPHVLTFTQTMPTGLVWFCACALMFVYAGCLFEIVAVAAGYSRTHLLIIPLAIGLRALLTYARLRDRSIFLGSIAVPAVPKRLKT